MLFFFLFLFAGDKFYLFLLRFTCYILKLLCTDEAKSVGKWPITHSDILCQILWLVAGKQVFLSNFVTSSEGFGNAHAEAAHYAMQSHLVRHSHGIQQRAHSVCARHKEWEEHARYMHIYVLSSKPLLRVYQPLVCLAMHELLYKGHHWRMKCWPL